MTSQNAIIKNQQDVIETLRARLAEIEKQEPVGEILNTIGRTQLGSEFGTKYKHAQFFDFASLIVGSKLYAAPVVSPDVEKLKAELEAARKDAERYRLIRSKLYGGAISIGEAYLTLRVVGSCPTLEQFDAAIEQAKGGVR